MKTLATLLALFGIALSSAACGPASENDTSSNVQTDTDSELNAAASSGAAPIGRAVHAKLRPLAQKVSLGFLGEDSGGGCVSGFRRGPAADLSAREVLRLFQFNVEAQLASDEFSFRLLDKKATDEFWADFLELQLDDEGRAASKEVHTLLSGPDVLGLAIMIPADRVAFGGSAFVTARMKDESLVVLRGAIGGMTL